MKKFSLFVVAILFAAVMPWPGSSKGRDISRGPIASPRGEQKFADLNQDRAFSRPGWDERSGGPPKTLPKKNPKSPAPPSKPVSKLKGKFWWIQFHDKQTYISMDGTPCEGRFDMEIVNKSGKLYGLYEGRAAYLSRGVKDTVQASMTIVCPEVKIEVSYANPDDKKEGVIPLAPLTPPGAKFTGNETMTCQVDGTIPFYLESAETSLVGTAKRDPMFNVPLNYDLHTPKLDEKPTGNQDIFIVFKVAAPEPVTFHGTYRLVEMK